MKKILTACLLAVSLSATAQTHVLDINTKKLGAPVQPTMYGIFFEDINYAADGGLYAEMVKNRSFEFPQHLMGWRAYGQFDVKDDGPFERNPHYVRLKYSGHSDKFTGLENEGFFGIAVKQGATYRFSVWARCPEGGKSTLEVSFVDNDTMDEDQRFATVKVDISGKEWKKYTATIESSLTEPKAALRIFLAGDKATTDVEHISLFPTDTWKGRENGMRRDLAQALADMHPGVFRFPGGCIVEGTDLETRYQWKNSVGPVENRPLNENRWHYMLMVDALCKRHSDWIDYFPAYEIVMDELRDYRFYASDMLHPSEQAVDYIWQRLREDWMSDEMNSFLDRYRPILLAENHRPLVEGDPANMALRQRIEQQRAELQKDYPYLKL